MHGRSIGASKTYRPEEQAMTPSLKDYAVSVWQLLAGQRTAAERHLAAERDRDVAPYLDVTGPLAVLDLANGRLRPQYALLAAAGHAVQGIDLCNRPGHGLSDLGYAAARGLYNLHIPRPAAHNPRAGLVCGNVASLPYFDNTFDLVTSIAAFEHFLDVPAALAELRRVLRPGGVAWIRIHPFTSLSGGHNVSLTEIPLAHLPPGVDAWDHLRRRRLPPYIPLNGWRIGQYAAAFAAQFEILQQYCALREGAHFLTPAVQAELADYTADELTCGTYVMLARKSETTQ
jgi:SAM-dependent methyltransferase